MRRKWTLDRRRTSESSTFKKKTKDFSLSRESGKDVCVDYVEFGQEDVIPFITLKRSGRLCGYRAGRSLYDDPAGQLLIWLKLGLSSANRSEVNIPGPGPPDPSPAPRLTLVITPYSTSRDYQLKKCQRCGRELDFMTDIYLNLISIKGRLLDQKEIFL